MRVSLKEDTTPPFLFSLNLSHTPSDLVVNQWAAEFESGSPCDFLLHHLLWTTFRRLMSLK
jgi:hypothetical protein